MGEEWITLLVPSGVYLGAIRWPLRFWLMIAARLGIYVVGALGALVGYRLGAVKGLGWQGARLGPIDIFNDAITLVVFGAAMFALGGYWAHFNVIVGVVMVATVFAFGRIGEIGVLRTDLTRWREWGPVAWGAHVGALVAVVGGIGYVLWLAIAGGLWPLLVLGAPLGALVFAVGAAVVGKKGYHPHHSTIFFIASLFLGWDNIVANVGAGVCIGVWLQGAISFGIGDKYFN